MTIAYCLLSGGIDSSTCLAEAVHLLDDPDLVRAASIDYGQRHGREIEGARAVADHYGVQHEVIKIDSIPRTMLTDPGVQVPAISYDEIKGISPSYVPFRNGMLLSTLAAHVAGRHLDPTREGVDPHFGEEVLLYFGAHAEDAANWAYPDCTPEFVGAMACAIYIGTYHKVRVITPFIHSTKDQIIARGQQLDVPYEVTWSCYRGGEHHCGECPTCRARKSAFRVAGVADPTTYLA